MFMANDPRFEVYPFQTFGHDPKKVFGWRFRAANGQITAVGGEGFTRREDARRAIGDFCDAFWVAYGNSPVDDPDELPPILDVDE